MDSKEIVERTFAFQNPERVARSFDSDLAYCGPSVKTPATDWVKTGDDRWERKDEWGNTWSRLDPASKGEVTRGVLDDLEELDHYRFPDYSDPEDYHTVSSARREQPDKWLIGVLPGFAFNIARNMRRLDQYLMDLLLEQDRIRKLHDRIDAMIADMIVNYAAAGADSVMFWEDWGSQTQTLISPQLWDDEFYPRFKALCSTAHDRGIKVIMHSCGKIEKIVPALIKAGIDCFQFDQPNLHDIDVLAAYQKEKAVTFWCPVDIQTTLQARQEKLIRAAARELLDKLWKGRGGFIAGYYHDNASIGLEPQWQQYACDEFLKRGIRDHYFL